MTGYGRSNASNAVVSITTEVSSVNRKQLELAINLPREHLALEGPVREQLQVRLARGRINVSISVAVLSNQLPEMIDPVAADRAFRALTSLQEKYGIKREFDITALLSFPGVIHTGAISVASDEIRPLVDHTLQEALTQLLAMREREGEELRKDLHARLQTLRTAVSEIERLHPAVAEKYRSALFERVRKIGLEMELDDDRLLRETVLYAERIDISEELTRLGSHFDQFSEKLTLDEPVGRTLEFIVQEVGREFNTLGAKANDSAISQIVVTCKADLEKIREQVQNIE